MQLPSVDRNTNLRPAAEVASSGANRVIPIAPVNPSVSPSPPLEPSPGVVNHVSPALQAAQVTAANTPTEGQPVYTSVPDPVKNSAASQQTPHDWTIHRPAPEKVESPPVKPISQVLLDHLKTMWTASAGAVQLEQVHAQLNVPPPTSSTQPVGQAAKQAVTYEPSKIKKTGPI